LFLEGVPVTNGTIIVFNRSIPRVLERFLTSPLFAAQTSLRRGSNARPALTGFGDVLLAR
jgi:hypothetical protein